MPWFRVDDQLHAHPKVLALFDGPCAGEALGLWLLAGSWCAMNLTDGELPGGALRRLGFGPEAAAELVRVGLWDALEAGGYRFNDWLTYNPSREKVLSDRDAAAKRMREQRAERRANRKRSSPERSGARSGDVRANVQPNIGDVRENFGERSHTPTRPDPIPKEQQPRAGARDAQAGDARGAGAREGAAAAANLGEAQAHLWRAFDRAMLEDRAHPAKKSDRPTVDDVAAWVWRSLEARGAEDLGAAFVERVDAMLAAWRVSPAAKDARSPAHHFAHYRDELFAGRPAAPAPRQGVTEGAPEPPEVEAIRARLKGLREARSLALGEGRIDDVISIEAEMSVAKKDLAAARKGAA